MITRIGKNLIHQCVWGDNGFVVEDGRSSATGILYLILRVYCVAKFEANKLPSQFDLRCDVASMVNNWSDGEVALGSVAIYYRLGPDDL